MEALTEHLAQLDPHVQGTIKVVAFYDTLMRRRVDLDALARASAGLASCPVGIRLHGSGREIRVAPPGAPAGTPTGAPITLDDEEIGTVWLERAGPSHPLDVVVLDRLALAVAAAVERYGPASTTMADPALVEAALGADEPARARALRLLGFSPDRPPRVVAVRSGPPLDRVGAAVCPSRLVKAATLTDVGVLLATTIDSTAFPPGAEAGLGRDWREARTALRFATPRQPVIVFDDLGALALLASLPLSAILTNPDISAIGRLAADDLETLEIYCETGSLRRAADRLHRHHSSVARRLDQIGKALGFDLADPFRARLAVTARRLSQQA
jgi:PucR-like helix-turn-helix protein